MAVAPATIKRIANDMKLLRKNEIELIDSHLDDKDIFTLYFMIKGAPATHYEGGNYIGKLMIPKTYPQSAPDIMMLTPSGRYNINLKICLSNSGYHNETWTPMWNFKTILMGFISNMSDDKDMGLNHIKTTKEERNRLAKQSFDYNVKFYLALMKNFVRFVETLPDGTVRMRTNEEIRKIDDLNNPKKSSKAIDNKDNKDIKSINVAPVKLVSVNDVDDKSTTKPTPQVPDNGVPPVSTTKPTPQVPDNGVPGNPPMEVIEVKKRVTITENLDARAIASWALMSTRFGEGLPNGCGE